LFGVPDVDAAFEDGPELAHGDGSGAATTSVEL
jgi:hypothetical protein